MSKVKFYTEQEKKELQPYVNGAMVISEENLKGFCKKYKRTFGAVEVFIYTARRKNKEKLAPQKRLKFHYTQEERNALTKIAEQEGKPDKALIQEFCNKYKRGYTSSINFVYKTKRSLGVDVKTTKTANKVAGMLKQSEFIVRIIDWNIRKEQDGSAYLVFKY